MKRLLALALVIPTVALASTAFDGSWMPKPDSAKVSNKPDVYALANGTFSCSSCVPSYSIPADGMDQPVTGHDYADHIAVKVISNSSIEITAKLAGKTMNDIVFTLSADGSRLNSSYTNNWGDKPVTGTGSEKRIAAAPAGSHAISGSWLMDKLTLAPDAGQLVVIKGTGDGIQVSWNGQMIDAKFDGKRYAWSNDPGKTMSTFKKVSDTEIKEVDHRAGKITDVLLMTVSADGKTLTQVDWDKQRGDKTSVAFEKQP